MRDTLLTRQLVPAVARSGGHIYFHRPVCALADDPGPVDGDRLVASRAEGRCVPTGVRHTWTLRLRRPRVHDN